MTFNKDEIRQKIKAKIIDLAARLGNDAAELKDDEIIPASGFLDSAAILEMVVWYDEFFSMQLKQEEINIDNLGSIDAMTDYVLSRHAC
jgi:acyl carrier protein